MTDISNYDDSETAADVLRQHASGASTRRPESKAAARAKWTAKVNAFLDTPMGNGIPRDNLICLLAGDPLPAISKTAVLAIEGTDPALVIVEARDASHGPPALVCETGADVIEAAMIPPGRASWDVPQGVLFMGSVVVLWPLGYKPGDDRDLSRIGIDSTDLSRLVRPINQ